MALWKRAVLSLVLVLFAAVALAPSAGSQRTIANGRADRRDQHGRPRRGPGEPADLARYSALRSASGSASQRWSVPTSGSARARRLPSTTPFARPSAPTGGDDVEVRVEADRAQIRNYVQTLEERFGRPAKDAQLVGLDARPPGDQPLQWGRAVRRGTMTPCDRAHDQKAHPAAPAARDEADQADASRARSSGRSSSSIAARTASTSSTGRAGAHLPRRDRTGAVPDARPVSAHRRHAAESLVAPARLRLGQGAEADPAGARAIRSARAGWAWTAPGVGIHGTPDAASIGYSASHGCIRMLIPEATWLFDHVRIGTPVLIVPTDSPHPRHLRGGLLSCRRAGGSLRSWPGWRSSSAKRRSGSGFRAAASHDRGGGARRRGGRGRERLPARRNGSRRGELWRAVCPDGVSAGDAGRRRERLGTDAPSPPQIDSDS